MDQKRSVLTESDIRAAIIHNLRVVISSYTRGGNYGFVLKGKSGLKEMNFQFLILKTED